MLRRRVLIIDDEEDIRLVAALSLETVAGWDVSAASSGIEGIRRAAVEKPDAILLDVMMPAMDGPATFLELQKHQETVGIPVVLLTARARESDRRRFASLGVAAVLLKPFDPLTLSRQIADALGWRE